MDSRQKMAAYKPAAARSSACLEFVRSIVDEASFVEQGSFLSSSGNADFARQAIPGDGLVSGSASIAGQKVYLAVQDNEVYKGAVGYMHARKFAKACEQAIQAFTPFIAVLDSGGVRAEEGLAALEAVGLMYKAMADAKGLIPVIIVLRGPVAGALSLMIEQADAAIVLEDKGGLFLHGPGVTLAKEESKAAPEDLGGSGVLARSAGVVTLKVKDDKELASKLAQLLSYRRSDKAWPDNPNRLAPELNEIAAASDDGLDSLAVIQQVADKNSLLPMYEEYAKELYCALARLGNQAVAIVAETESALGLASAAKLTRFLNLAARFDLPLISFTTSAGFLDGSEAVRQGMALVAAQISAAFSSYPHARLNLYLGKAYGSHLLAFNSKFLGCDYAYAWPTAELGLLTADQAMSLFGKTDLEKLNDPIKEREGLKEVYAERYNAHENAAAAGLIDEVILPEASRPYLFSALQSLNDIY